MELPRKYPYKPRWKPLLAGVVVFGLAHWFFMDAAHNPDRTVSVISAVAGVKAAGWIYLGLSLATLAVAAVLAWGVVRGLRQEHFLELGEEAMVLPHGFLRVTDLRFPYAEIERVWQGKLFEKPVLYIKSGGRVFAVRPGRLRDMASYTEVREFLYSRVKLRREKSGPGLG